MQGAHSDELTNSDKHVHSNTAYEVLDNHFIGNVLPSGGEEVIDTNPLIERINDCVVQANAEFEVGFKDQLSDNLNLIRVQNRNFS